MDWELFSISTGLHCLLAVAFVAIGTLWALLAICFALKVVLIGLLVIGWLISYIHCIVLALGDF